MNRKTIFSPVLLIFGMVVLSGCNEEAEIHPTQDIHISTPLEKMVQEEQKNIEKISAGLTIEKISEDEKTITLQVILKNPQEETIQSVQSWFTYPTKILKGTKIALLSSDIFDLTAPGEQNFDTKNGLVKIGISVGGKGKQTAQSLPLAQIVFEKQSPSPYMLEFFNIGAKGNTRVMSFTPTGIRDILDSKKVEKYSPKN